jgi:hypothetical protein
MNSQPLYFLEQKGFANPRAAIRVHWFDYAFLTGALLFICGGALFALDMGSSYHAEQPSWIQCLIATMQEWLPVVWERLCTGVMLFLASVFNSALMVALVQLMRHFDRHISRTRQRHWQGFGVSRKAIPSNSHSNVVVEAMRPQQAAALSGFLLNPLIR